MSEGQAACICGSDGGDRAITIDGAVAMEQGART